MRKIKVNDTTEKIVDARIIVSDTLIRKLVADEKVSKINIVRGREGVVISYLKKI